MSFPISFGWFIPTTGDGRYVGVPAERESTTAYMVQVAQAAERAGYEFTLIPTGGACVDAWVIGSWIAAHTTKLKPLVAMRPGLMNPVLAARMAASLDKLSDGRALINVVTGHYAEDLKAMGDALYDRHDDRYNRTREFLEVVKGVWQEQGFDYEGEHYQVTGGSCQPPVVQSPHPPLYFGGSSPAGKRVAAEVADVYLMWIEPLEWIQSQIEEMKGYLHELAERKGVKRSLRYGLRAQVIVRETEEEAWKQAEEIISKASPEVKAAAEQRHANTDATNQRRQIELFQQSKASNHIIGPNLWSGLSAIRGGGAVAFVGTPDQVSDRILEFYDLGVTTFILSGYPHLEEAQTTGDLLLPLVRRKLAQRGGDSDAANL
ncbi:LLM class flavin-dependent oxidoreductase [Paenibacillus piri]|uniref:LLM class flavin-dependent oxidoreductase n=1 Tax=Paenibacillus piri TaxID=2547395 RepID=A0A4R5KTA0_9BACL|nr:LLM class flavin-dependent oxidoreductase [Paenibacillus piri]TDF98120.1 LLM class flavin-dependent oxidoreductase [Paenibacillus piri]